VHINPQVSQQKLIYGQVDGKSEHRHEDSAVGRMAGEHYRGAGDCPSHQVLVITEILNNER
jgi:hypothetical protein